MSDRQFHTIVMGGGVLGGACAIALSRKLGPGQVALLESKVIGAGLSSRHSGIVRAVNRNKTAAQMAKRAVALWQQLESHWGVPLQVQKLGALWIGAEHSHEFWHRLEQDMHKEGIELQRLSPGEVAALCNQAILITPDEIYFYEPEALLLNPAEVLAVLQMALQKHNVAVFEHCQVREITQKANGAVQELVTDQGRFCCENLVNATGAWSAQLFARCGLIIPVAWEPVLVANFLIGSGEIPENLPVIADHVNGFYFRSWPGSQLHVHRPRSRNGRSISAAFARCVFDPQGADRIYEAERIDAKVFELYRHITRIRFPQLGNPVSLSISQSVFDITPDLNFILGRDPRSENLFHCLGAGQAFKYAPIFGEIIAALVCGEELAFDLRPFSIERFLSRPLEECFLNFEAEPF